ncbi:MAG: hypothetical protein QOF86_2034, partial [Baekduia sp.]|nr:hypothetical protein [Baekduia sp.]
MTTSMEFAGMRAVVTGGASGIGLATACLLVERGARVAVLDRSADPAPVDAEQVRCDVGDDASVRSAVTAAAEALGGIDILINNAGIGARG